MIFFIYLCTSVLLFFYTNALLFLHTTVLLFFRTTVLFFRTNGLLFLQTTVLLFLPMTALLFILFILMDNLLFLHTIVLWILCKTVLLFLLSDNLLETADLLFVVPYSVSGPFPFSMSIHYIIRKKKKRTFCFSNFTLNTCMLCTLAAGIFFGENKGHFTYYNALL